MKTRLSTTRTAAAVAFGVVIGLALCVAVSGCQSPLERADPASKSARATYGAISLVASGDNASCSLTIGDGAFTAADGDGATSTSASNAAKADGRLTASVPGSALAAGISAGAAVLGKGIDAYTATHGSDAAARPSSLESPSLSGADCEDCDVSADCADGSCDVAVE